MYIYLDESGNLTGRNGKYFIVGSYTVGDPRRIGNSFRKWQTSKFPKKLKDQTEIKFNDSHIRDELRLKTSLFLKLPPKTLFNIQAVDSTTSPQVQVADWICGALARCHEGKPLGEKLYVALKRNIVEKRELFSDYWGKKWE